MREKNNKKDTVVGIYNKLPLQEGRLAEGGLRIQSKKKGLNNNNAQPLVTVITVSKNSSKTIENTIASVKNQTYKRIEYIVIDACSDDGTVEILKKYDRIIDYYVSEPDRGLYNAMNKGLSVASGEYILFLNSDDSYAKDCVEKLLNTKLNSGADFSSALSLYVNGDGEKLYTLESMLFDGQVRLRMPLRHELMLISRDIYNEIGGYDDSLKIISDLEFAIRLFEKNYVLAEVAEPLLYFRNDGVSNTQTKKLINERKILIKRQFPFLTEQEIESLSVNETVQDEIQDLLIKYGDRRQLTKALLDLSRRIFPGFIDSNFIKKHYPMISVIIAIHNAEDTLRACLDSVISQSFSGFEIVCVNDCSPDASLKILEEYKLKDDRVVIVNNESNKGLGQTRNNGVRNSLGKFIFHLDPDDILPQNALEKLISTAEENDSDIVKGSFIKINSEFKQIGRSPVFSEKAIVNTNLRNLPALIRSTEGHWSCLYRNELAKKICYPVDLKMGQDTLYLVRVFEKAQKISVINDIVYKYAVRANSTMNNYNLRKLNDDCRWRQRVYNIWKEEKKLKPLAVYYIQEYWDDRVLKNLANILKKDECFQFFMSWSNLMNQNKIEPACNNNRVFFSQLASCVYRKKFRKAYLLLCNDKLINNLPVIAARGKIYKYMVNMVPGKIRPYLAPMRKLF